MILGAENFTNDIRHNFQIIFSTAKVLPLFGVAIESGLNENLKNIDVAQDFY